MWFIKYIQWDVCGYIYLVQHTYTYVYMKKENIKNILKT